LPLCPLQLHNISITDQGITHATPNSCNNAPHNSSNHTVQEQMIDGLSSNLTHITPFHHNNIPLA